MDYEIPSTKHILLTGAGFTKNFGGYLAREMWTKLQLGLEGRNDRLLKEIKKEFDYEKLFQKIVKSVDYEDEEKEVFNKLLLDTYKEMDDDIKDSVSDITKLNFSINGVRNLLERFAEKGKGRNTSFFFTLNQDIYIERQFYGILSTLYVRTDSEIRSFGGKKKFDNYFSIVPTESELKEMQKTIRLEDERFRYVKLHGSFNWKNPNNKNTIVIGTSKEEDIENEPILNCYLDIFNDVLSNEECRLLIIGYGFRDSHINNIILKSVTEKKLKIFVICHTDPEVFRNETLKNVDCNESEDILWDAITCYPYTFERIFPQDGISREYSNLIKQLFEST